MSNTTKRFQAECTSKSYKRYVARLERQEQIREQQQMIDDYLKSTYPSK